MAKRRRKAKPPIFKVVFVLSLLLGIALFGIPKSPEAILMEAAAVAAFSTVVALGIAALLRREAEDDLIRKEPQLTTTNDVDTSRWNSELLKRLEWRRFEELCAGYFEVLDFRAQTTRFGADGGVDIKLYKGDSQTPAIIVQCKAWNAYTVGVKPVRELRGVMAAQKVNEGVFVTSGAFTKEARDFAAQEKIHLINGDGLVEKMLALPSAKSEALLRLATEGDFATPTCPSCGVKMTRRESRKDRKAFWGCVNYPRCRHTFFGLGAAQESI